MGVLAYILRVCFILSAIMTFLTYTPADSKYFWIYWCAVSVFFFFGNLLEVMFTADSSFIYDPSAGTTHPQMLSRAHMCPCRTQNCYFLTYCSFILTCYISCTDNWRRKTDPLA